MLWELKAPLWVGQIKENLGLDGMFKFLRYFNMYLGRYREKVNGIDYTYSIENNLLWSGKVCFYNDKVLNKLMVLKIDSETKDPNGNLIKVDASGENGYKKKGLKVDEDCVVLYADSTHLPPIIYLWAIATEIITRDDIIRQQDNMLRKPILVTGTGEAFDNAMNKLENVLSGVSFINTKSKKSKGDNIMTDTEMQVLNLQTNNSYKGAELWQSREHFEDLLRDFMGYPSVNNEKRERMITDEVNQTQAFAKTKYENDTGLRKEAFEKCSSILGVKVEFSPILKWEEPKEEGKEEKENDSKEEMD